MFHDTGQMDQVLGKCLRIQNFTQMQIDDVVLLISQIIVPGCRLAEFRIVAFFIEFIEQLDRSVADDFHW